MGHQRKLSKKELKELEEKALQRLADSPLKLPNLHVEMTEKEEEEHVTP